MQTYIDLTLKLTLKIHDMSYPIYMRTSRCQLAIVVGTSWANLIWSSIKGSKQGCFLIHWSTRRVGRTKAKERFIEEPGEARRNKFKEGRAMSYQVKYVCLIMTLKGRVLFSSEVFPWVGVKGGNFISAFLVCVPGRDVAVWQLRLLINIAMVSSIFVVCF